MNKIEVKRPRGYWKRRVAPFDVFNVILFLILNFIMLFPFWSILMTSFVTSAEAMRKTFILWPDSFRAV